MMLKLFDLEDGNILWRTPLRQVNNVRIVAGANDESSDLLDQKDRPLLVELGLDNLAQLMLDLSMITAKFPTTGDVPVGEFRLQLVVVELGGMPPLSKGTASCGRKLVLRAGNRGVDAGKPTEGWAATAA